MAGVILAWLGKLLGGPFIRAALDAYQAKLAADTDKLALQERLAARWLELEAKEAELTAARKAATIGKWYEPEHLFAYTLWIYFSKIYLYDAAFGLGTTDAVRGEAAGWAAMVIAFWFGKRTVENVLRIWKAR
jgi:hypothetical protein